MTIEWTQRYTPRPWSRDFGDALRGGDRAYLEEQLDAVMQWSERCTPRLWSSEFGDALVEAVIERVWRYTWRPWSSQFGDTVRGHDRASLEICTWRPWWCELGGLNWASLEIHLEAVIERDSRCTWRPWSSEFRGTLGGRDQVSLEIDLEAVIKWVWRFTWRPWSSEIGQVLGRGRWTARRDSIHQLVNAQPWECDKVTLPLKLIWTTGWWRAIGREVRRRLKLHSGVNLKLWEWRDDRQS